MLGDNAMSGFLQYVFLMWLITSGASIICIVQALVYIGDKIGERNERK
jgi:hypothetical protein